MTGIAVLLLASGTIPLFPEPELLLVKSGGVWQCGHRLLLLLPFLNLFFPLVVPSTIVARISVNSFTLYFSLFISLFCVPLNPRHLAWAVEAQYMSKA